MPTKEQFVFSRKFTPWVYLFCVSLLLSLFVVTQNVLCQEQKSAPLWAKIDQLSLDIEANAIAWRRDIHQHPELGYQEFRTAKLVAEHLKSLGIEVKTGVAKTGVVGILRGKKDTPVVALRADMDALPITEAVNVPFASKVKAQIGGKEVGVMHACGHDVHTAILMGAAEVLSKVRDEIPGTVKFIFQPTEEVLSTGEEGGAASMIKEGVLESPKPDSIFGLHVLPFPVKRIRYRAGGIWGSVDKLEITIKGTQTHAGGPWAGVDPIVVASQVVLGIQTVISRQIDLTDSPAVISIASIHGGEQFGTIPDKVEMIGRIAALDPKIQKQIHERIQKTAKSIAESAGATAEVKISKIFPVTFNDPDLTGQMAPTLERVVGKGKLIVAHPSMGGEDFSCYQEKIPGLFFFLGIAPEGGKFVPSHSPDFYVDENAILVGIRAMANLAIDFLGSK